ncbi:MAG: hypothetical protein Q4D79_00115 [Propionibacteriaceae bacterium]|nr:hypothetical protein [Propionibacteriaceae bacterium]
MTEVRVTCPTKNLLICAIPVQFVGGEALVSEEIAEQLRPYAKAHGLRFPGTDDQSPAPKEREQPSEEKPVEESPKVPRKPQGKRAVSPFGN